MTGPAEIDLDALKQRLWGQRDGGDVSKLIPARDVAALIAAVEALRERVGKFNGWLYERESQLAKSRHETNNVQRELKAAEALRKQAAEQDKLISRLEDVLKGTGLRNSDLEARAEAAEAHAVELAGALEILHECSPCQNGCAPDDMNCASNMARAVLAKAKEQAP